MVTLYSIFQSFIKQTKIYIQSVLPKKVSELTNDAGYLTSHQDISGKQDKLAFDTTPTANSANPVTSSGIKTAIDTAVSTAKTEIEGKIPEVDARLSTTSENPVQNKVIKAELSNYVTGSDVSSALTQYAKKTDVPAVTVSGNTISFGSITIGVD